MEPQYIRGRRGYNRFAMRVLDTKQMQACDRAAIEDDGIPELVLMENAGTQVVESMEEFFGDEQPELVAVLCGKGNNGGDGLVIARHLHNLGRVVRVYLFADPAELDGSVVANHRMAMTTGVEIVGVADGDAWDAVADDLPAFDCVVDALFGTGIKGALRGHFGDVVDDINASGAAIVAVDLPSGLSADSGDVVGPAVDADLTVTFEAPKLCHAFPPACELCGELGIVDIGIPRHRLEAVDGALDLLTPADVAGILDPRQTDTHKGSYGRVVIVAGSPGMAGAAALAARAALRGGAGLVTVAAPDSVFSIIAAQVVEALVQPLASNAHGGFAAAAQAGLMELAATADVLAVGPGIGTSPETAELIRALVTASSVPVVLDADGLNAFVGDFEELQKVGPPCIITPHPGEAARLLGITTAEVQNDRVGAARDLAARSGAIAILKGYRSLIASANGAIAVNPTGNPGMATGGSGDVLTGLIAAFVGQGVEPVTAARAGAFYHGEAGDRAAELMGEVSLIASDIIDMLPEALMRFEVDG